MTPPAVADVVLPCLDEAAALPEVLARIPPGWRAVVVDNGSTDGSARIAAGLGAHVVHEPRRGFGAACHAGLLAATADLVCFCDCDGSLDPALLPALAAPVLAGEADLVLGRRRPTAFGSWPPHARLANLELARRVRRRTGLPLHDLGPLRVARRTALLSLGLTDRRSGYPLEMVVRAADAGWRVRETDVPYAPRKGRSKVTGTWRGTWQAVHDMTTILTAPLEPPEPAGLAAFRGSTVPEPAEPMAGAGAAELTEPACFDGSTVPEPAEPMAGAGAGEHTEPACFDGSRPEPAEPVAGAGAAAPARLAGFRGSTGPRPARPTGIPAAAAAAAAAAEAVPPAAGAEAGGRQRQEPYGGARNPAVPAGAPVSGREERGW